MIQDVRQKVLSVTRECCHYLQNCQGNGVALLRQINANFLVSTADEISTLLFDCGRLNNVLFNMLNRLLQMFWPLAATVPLYSVRAPKVIGHTVDIGNDCASL